MIWRYPHFRTHPYLAKRCMGNIKPFIFVFFMCNLFKHDAQGFLQFNWGILGILSLKIAVELGFACQINPVFFRCFPGRSREDLHGSELKATEAKTSGSCTCRIDAPWYAKVGPQFTIAKLAKLLPITPTIANNYQ